MERTGVGVIGCGVISEIYLENLTTRFSGVQVIGCADTIAEKSKARAAAYGIRQMTVEEMLACSDIHMILNLTTPRIHMEIALAALEHGKHVYNEKPLCATRKEAQSVMELAKEKGLYVGCAPDTFLGAGLQTARKALDDGWIGRAIAGSAFITTPGHERWHIDPAFYYQPGGGPNLDMGPYYITALVALLGPIKSVNSMSSRAYDKRVVGSGKNAGQIIPVEVDTHYSTSLTFMNGAVITAIMSFDIWATHLPFIEIYGTAGTLTLPDPNFFDGEVLLQSRYEDAFIPIPMQNPFTNHNLRGLGPAQMCHAIRKGTAHCASGELALHVLEVLEAMTQASQSGKTYTCVTSCERPAALPYGLAEAQYEF
ncbi:MAG: Gfo/Idh/MocA family oxidoreductase [Oscillospiraceae bacterium]|nr:Gfo/Idh/MocA family oxidoreductase [Oscillospiraceae bacterium]